MDSKSYDLQPYETNAYTFNLRRNIFIKAQRRDTLLKFKTVCFL